MNTKPWTYPTKIFQGGDSVPPDDIYCILDMDEGYMAFATDEAFLGVAARGLKGKVLYPMVSAVWGRCQVTMKYVGGLDRKFLPLKNSYMLLNCFLAEPCQLMDICRHTILSQIGKKQLKRIYDLPLPMSMKNYVMYK